VHPEAEENPLRDAERDNVGVNLAAIMAELERVAKEGESSGRSLPPVERWNPPYCGEAGIEIRTDGTWWHEGVRVTRDRLIRLFSSILRRDEDGFHYLVTPVEKVRVVVEDAPFLAVRVDKFFTDDGPAFAFTTNMGDVAVAGPGNPIRVTTDPRTAEPRPYILVRGRLEARILRPPFYELVEASESRDGMMGIMSQGIFFPLGPEPVH
jgi:uncharacterized protein